MLLNSIVMIKGTINIISIHIIINWDHHHCLLCIHSTMHTSYMKEVKTLMTQKILEMLQMQQWTTQSCSDQGLRRGCHSCEDGGDDERQEVPEEIRSLLRERVLLRGGHGGHDQDDGDDGGHAVLGQSVHQGVHGPHQGELDEHGVKHVEWKMNKSFFSAFWDLLDVKI